MRITAVIPTLDEAATSGECLAAIHRLPGTWESVVVDGGSRDGTQGIAQRAGASRVLETPRGRGLQPRAGAAAARGDAILFLHADARLPDATASRVAETLADPRWSGGAFRLRHAAGAGSGALLRRLLRVADLRSRYTRSPYGDQAVFTSRRIYEEVGGIPPLPLLEDLEFARRLRRRGPIRRLSEEVRVSGRRFERAPLRTFLCWNLFPLLHALRVDPARLARWYGDPRRETGE